MTFHSILFPGPQHEPPEEQTEAPDTFVDLNLDQLVTAISSSKPDYNLAPFFHTTLGRAEAVRYRQAAVQDLDGTPLLAAVNAFAEQMSQARRFLKLISKLYYPRHKQGWYLEAVLVYCAAVTQLAADLQAADLRSPGFKALRRFLTEYTASASFTALSAEASQVKAGLAAVRYAVNIRGDTIRVQRYDDEPDYSTEVEATFAKFKQGAVKDYRARLAEASGMNHIEAQILEQVAKLFPDEFAALDTFATRPRDFPDPIIGRFDREVQFYIAYLGYIDRVRAAGLSFCYPEVSSENKSIFSADGFDLVLAAVRARDGQPVVTNDFRLDGAERVIVVSGPNQGGKTTFARAFGQLHYLGCLGLPVPGREARLFLFDRLFTHFEREEDIQNLRGKLQDDLVRIHAILEAATPRSIVIMNEMFSSTSLEDAVYLSKEVMTRIVALDLIGVWVTFLDELAAYGPQTVSMVSTVVPDNPVERTFKVVRRPADGLAYALSIAEKYRLTRTLLLDRIPS